jgi:hypothetical protein
MSQSVPCPFCGELMTPPIKFCVGCGRGVTPEDMKNAGLRMNTKRPNDGGRFALAKREYSMHRKMRSMFWSSTAVMVIVIGYYGACKFLLHEEPWAMIEKTAVRLMKGEKSPSPEAAMADPAAASSPRTDVPALAHKPVKVHHKKGH